MQNKRPCFLEQLRNGLGHHEISAIIKTKKNCWCNVFYFASKMQVTQKRLFVWRKYILLPIKFPILKNRKICKVLCNWIFNAFCFKNNSPFVKSIGINVESGQLKMLQLKKFLLFDLNSIFVQIKSDFLKRIENSEHKTSEILNIFCMERKIWHIFHFVLFSYFCEWNSFKKIL